MKLARLDIDVREVLEQLETTYNLKLPCRVITIDYDEGAGDLVCIE